jgi:hypothetical protein
MHGGRTMPQRYRVKIGEVHLESAEPISTEARDKALAHMKAYQKVSVIAGVDGMLVKLSIDGHGDGHRVKPIG